MRQERRDQIWVLVIDKLYSPKSTAKLRRRLADTEQQLNDEEEDLKTLESLPNTLSNKIKKLEIEKNDATTTTFTARSTKLDGEIRQKEVEHDELQKEKHKLEGRQDEEAKGTTRCIHTVINYLDTTSRTRGLRNFNC